MNREQFPPQPAKAKASPPKQPNSNEGQGKPKLNQIRQSGQQQINEAQAKLNQIQQSGQQQINEAKANLDRIAEVRPVDIATAAKQAKANLDLAYIRAPRDAQVLKIHTHPGEKVGNDSIVELGQTRQMLAVGEIYKSDADKVRLRQTAKITSDALTGQLRGTVEHIGLQVQRQNIVNTDPSANTDSRIVEVNLTNLQVKVASGEIKD